MLTSEQIATVARVIGLTPGEVCRNLAAMKVRLCCLNLRLVCSVCAVWIPYHLTPRASPGLEQDLLRRVWNSLVSGAVHPTGGRGGPYRRLTSL